MLIKLETFDGSYEKWPAFWRCFKYEVDMNKDLGDSWKHRLLLQQLTGPAKDSIAPFAGDPNSYKRVIAQLKRSFDNPTAARDAIVKKFCALPPLKRSSVEGLRALLAAFDAASSTLKTLRLPDRSHEARISAAVMQQSPAEVQMILKRLSRKSWSKIRRALDEELRCLESSRVAFATSPIAASAPTSRNARVYSTVVSKACAFCNNDHRTAECRVYYSFQARTDRLRSLKLCGRCMRPNHTADRCPKTSIKCFDCQGPHYRFLCPVASVRPSTPS